MSVGATLETLEDLLSVDKLVHEPARLSIVALLSVVQRADFVFVQSQTGLTAGNVSSHINKLAKAGYVEVDKRFIDNRPKTMLALTPNGRAALAMYLHTMRTVLAELGA